MSSQSALVSIVIPTRERPDTLFHALRTAVEQSWKNVEIIVSDNGGHDATRTVVEGFGDPRIRYVKTDGRVSMSENFEFALSHATGDWLSVIGDDDGLLPTGLERALAALSATGLEALGSRSVHYRWPYEDRPGPEMYLTVPTSRGFEVRDSRRNIEHLMRGRAFFTESPMLYTGGLVSRRIFNAIKQKRGTFFHSQIPDVFSGFAICSTVDRYVFLREPAMVAGHSRHSHGTNIGGEQAKIFRRESTIPFHADLAVENGDPLTASTSALLYECFLQTNYLRSTRIEVDPAFQLRISLDAMQSLANEGGEFGSFLERWRNRFMARHQLDPETDLRHPASHHLINKFRSIRQRKRDLLGSYRVDSFANCDGSNVFEASLTAEKILRDRPALAANLARSFKRVLFNKLRPNRNALPARR